MPAFPSLTEQEVEDAVSYVIHLSVRGEVELASMAKMIKPGDDDPLYTGGEIDWLFMQNELWVLAELGSRRSTRSRSRRNRSRRSRSG